MQHMKNVMLTLTMAASGAIAFGQDGSFDWRTNEGQTIHVQLIQNVFANTIRPRVAEFEALTGITVVLEVLPEDQARDRVRVELQAGSREMDVFWGEPSRFGQMFVANGWYEPLAPYLADPARTHPDFAWPHDWLPATVAGVSIQDQIVGIPVDRQTAPVLAYRKDILEDLGIAVPTTFEELTSAIEAAHVGTPSDVYGITLRGRGAQTTSRVAPIIAEFGGAWEDLDGNPTLASDETIAGIRWYGDVLRQFGPPGAANLAWPDSNAIFLGGKAVFTIEDSVNAARVLDPALSVVADQVGFAAMPLGPGGTAARSHEPCVLPAIWALSMSSFSDDKDAAWLFIQWAISTENQVAYLENGRPAARDSAFFSEAFAAYRAENLPEYWDVLLEATATLCYRNPQFAPPSIVDQGRARDIIGEVVVTAILGGDVEGAARDAQSELEALRARQ